MPVALDAAYPVTFNRLRALFRARGLTPEDAADLAQEAAARAILHLRRWGQDGDGLDPLLNRIARNLLIDRVRSAAPRVVSLDDAEEVGDASLDPSEEVSRRHVRRAVRRAIGELPPRHRTAINFSLAGMSPAQVAERMGIRRNAADALLHRARRSLAERLRSTGHDMLGAFGLVGLKIRVVSRRVLEHVRTLDSASVGVVNAVATVALVSTLALGGPQGATASPAARDDVRTVSATTVVSAGTLLDSGAPGRRTPSVARPAQPSNSFKANVEPGRRVRAQTPTPAGCIWFDLWKEHGGAAPSQGSGAPWLDVWEEGGGSTAMPGC